jgi:hypothetical protein
MNEDDKMKGLVTLLNEMRNLGIPFNAAIIGSGMHPGGDGDVARLHLVDNATDWEACYETGTYDLWRKGHLTEHDLSLSEAAKRLVKAYQDAKLESVIQRMTQEINKQIIISHEDYSALPKDQQLIVDGLRAEGKLLIRKDKMK